MRDAGHPSVGRCVLLLAIAAALAGMGPALAAEKVMVGKGGQNAFVFSMIDVGIRSGAFARHGLDVQTAEFNGGARMQQALAAGSIDIGAGGGTDLATIVKGSPVKGIAVLGGPPLDFGITVKASGPIRTVADLKGKKIGVTTAASLTAWLTGEFSRLQGWGSDGIVRVATGSAATSWALLRTGEIDGFTGDIGNALQFEVKGDGKVLVRLGESVKDFVTFMVFARNEAIEKRPDVVRAFLAGLFDGIAYARANREETIKICMDVLGHEHAISREAL